ncbi:phosphatidylethanolamine-binding protein [Ditylenchus destructor]|nr:phosphatidylethanolamine-binding protein [Ditylenchus destructor]
MIMRYIILCILLLGYTAGTELEDKLDSYGIGADIIGEIPSTALNVDYLHDDDQMTLDENYVGMSVTPSETKDKPFLVTWNLEEGVDEEGLPLYALAMVEKVIKLSPDLDSPQFSGLVVNIAKYSMYADNGNELAPYEGPAPPSDEKPYHRYIFLLYRQSKKIKIDELKVIDRTEFNVLDFALENELGAPIAANFFVTKNEKAQEELHDDVE